MIAMLHHQTSLDYAMQTLKSGHTEIICYEFSVAAKNLLQC